jgi:hypothetical protein
MADLNVQRNAEPVVEDDYTMLEVFLWIAGILAIPLVPIAMIALFTPMSGM